MVRLWHAALAAIVAFTVVGQAVVNVDQGRSLVNLFSYFTVQSNLLVGVAAALVALDPRRSGWLFGSVRLAGLVGITVTGLVYVTVLRGTLDLTGWDRTFDTLFHYVVPAVAVLGYVLFTPRTPLERRYLVFLVWPLAWLVYTLVRAEIAAPEYARPDGTSPVPYDFLDVADLGGGAVAVNCVGVLVLALGLAAVYLRLGRPHR